SAAGTSHLLIGAAQRPARITTAGSEHPSPIGGDKCQVVLSPGREAGAPGAVGSTPGTYGYGQTSRSSHLAPSRPPLLPRVRQSDRRGGCVFRVAGCVFWPVRRARGMIVVIGPVGAEVGQTVGPALA